MNVADLREILQYVPKFRGKTFVVAIDGEVVESENFANILLDLAVLRSLNIKVAIVHGASRQIERSAAERGITISNSDGTGIVDAATLQVSIDASIRLTNEIMEGLSAVDLRAAYANAIIAHPAGIIHGVDYEFSGRVERVDTKALNLLLEEGIVPVIPPMGFDGEGRTFRVNSDWVAIEVAEALREDAAGSAFNRRNGAFVPCAAGAYHKFPTPRLPDALRRAVCHAINAAMPAYMLG